MKLREYDFTKGFAKKFIKLKGKELENVKKKMQQILSINDLNHYKNLKFELSKYKRVHVNSHFVIIFYDKTKEKIIFVNYAHHDEIYDKKSK